MKIKNNDFIEIDYDLYANDKLVQTTNEKRGKEAKIQAKKFGPITIIVGKEFLLKAVDEALIKSADALKENTLELEKEEAYGSRKKEMIKVLPKSAFNEHKTRPVLGMIYDFNGMYGTVKSIIGGRVMVDFNNPLAGKKIRITYKVVKIIEDVKFKTDFIFENVLKIPQNMFGSSVTGKILTLRLPEQLHPILEMIKKTVIEYVPELKDFEIKIEKFKK